MLLVVVHKEGRVTNDQHTHKSSRSNFSYRYRFLPQRNVVVVGINKSTNYPSRGACAEVVQREMIICGEKKKKQETTLLNILFLDVCGSLYTHQKYIQHVSSIYNAAYIISVSLSLSLSFVFEATSSSQSAER